MAVYIITYDLNKEVVRPNIVKKIKEFGSWARLSESSYAVESSSSPQAIYQSFAPLLDSNDNLFVITLSAPWWGQGPQDVLNWLKQRVR